MVNLDVSVTTILGTCATVHAEELQWKLKYFMKLKYKSITIKFHLSLPVVLVLSSADVSHCGVFVLQRSVSLASSLSASH